MNKTITLIAIVIISLLFLSAWRDEKIAEGADRYADCIAEQYGMSPASYYKSNGEYPICE